MSNAQQWLQLITTVITLLTAIVTLGTVVSTRRRGSERRRRVIARRRRRRVTRRQPGQGAGSVRTGPVPDPHTLPTRADTRKADINR